MAGGGDVGGQPEWREKGCMAYARERERGRERDLRTREREHDVRERERGKDISLSEEEQMNWTVEMDSLTFDPTVHMSMSGI